MKLLLESGADPNFLSVHGNNLSPSALPLMTASANGFYDGVELLLSYKADIDGTDSLHGTALVQAATVGDIKMLQLLIKRGANINETGGIYHSAVNAACYLGHLDCVKFLVETGADLKTVYKHLDGRIPNYGTALHCACDTGNDDIVDYLLSKGADVNSPGADLGTALEVAIYAGRESIALKLLELGAKLVETPGACSEIVVRIISTLSRGEGDRSFRETMEKLAHIRSYRATGGLIHAAAFYGSLPLITALVKAGTPIDLERQPLGTPLMAAIEGNQIEAVKCLLDLGADITYQCEIGTALQVACLRGRLSIVDMLLGLGLDVNSVDIQTGMGSPLQAATIGGHRDVLARLLERGARLNAYYDRDPDDRVGIDSPLCLAAIRGQVEVIELFMNHTPRPTDYDVHRAATEAATEGDGEAIPTLIRCGWNPNSTTGGVVLFHLAYRGRAEEIALLLSHGTPLISSDVGNNALHVAAREGHFNSVRAFLNSPRKFDLEAEGSWGQTALDKAAENGYLEVVKLLVHHGADVDSVADDCLKSSAWAAARNGHVDVVQYLAANGASNVISRSDGTYEYTLSDEPDNDENFSIRVLRYLDSLRKCASLAPFDHCSEARQKVEPAPTAKAETPQRNPQRRFEGPAHLIFDESVELRVSPIVLGEMLSHELGQTLMAYEEQERPPIPIEDSKYDNEEHPGSILEHFIQNLCRISRIARENSQESDDASPEQP
jgi:ankyrin repeat protein